MLKDFGGAEDSFWDAEGIIWELKDFSMELNDDFGPLKDFTGVLEDCFEEELKAWGELKDVWVSKNFSGAIKDFSLGAQGIFEMLKNFGRFS